MTMLSNHAVAVALPLSGTQLARELRTFFQASHYAPVLISEALAHIEARGTATGCPSLEPADQVEANGIIMNRLGSVECDPASWPAVFDEEIWNLTDIEPAAAPIPSDAGPSDYEPSHAERGWWASHAPDSVLNAPPPSRAVSPELARINADFARLRAGFPAPICGGAPTADEKPIRIRRHRHEVGNPELTDEDHLIATGCV